ncbi:GFA family protein [Pseudoruegeria sp. HB172150]|uniref:GFA family protein n=1 Tax=Pseudoruegeria sp. HB172150 TaxID=2721164 RepID=UPI001557E360|nr:GFA family protein [Pseudoruegeria sp. HB172150]
MTEDGQEVVQGHCLCGACTFELTGPHNWVGHCHCESCRRATASPFTTWIGQENGRWSFTGTEPVAYASSAGNTRGFCGTCGSPMYYRSERYPNEVHFYAALLEDPEAVEPAAHFHAGEMLRWVHLADSLPRK